MGKSLQELNLKDEPLPEMNFEDMPEFGSWTPPPQPGKGFRFKLPADLTDVWDVFDAKGDVQRVRAEFDSTHPLLIIAGPGIDPKAPVPFQTRISNATRPRGKDKIEISDMDLLLRALGQTGSRPRNNKGYIEAVKAHFGKEFTADISYSWICSDSRNVRVRNADGQIVEVENQKGCGRNYYEAEKTQDNTKKATRMPDGTYGEVVCGGYDGRPCGNVIRPFANLDSIRA